MTLPEAYWEQVRSEFFHDQGIYLDGNSLGLLSCRSEQSLLNALDQWKSEAISGWTSKISPWIDYSLRLAELMAPLVGASADEVTVASSTTVNLHQLLATLYRPTPARSKIVIDSTAFPSDRYAIESHLQLHGIDVHANLRVIQPDSDRLLDTKAIVENFGHDVALALLPSVVYTTGQLLDIDSIGSAARAQGICLGIDCSHSIGVVPHGFGGGAVDFAVWCGYKYLNGGPGSTAGMYLSRRHHGVRPGLAGWFGIKKSSQFRMETVPDFAIGAPSLQIGTPHILSMAPLFGSLQMIAETGIENLRNRSLELTEHLIRAVDRELKQYGVEIVTPRESSQRGGHISIAHPSAQKVCISLRKAGVVPDFRMPDLIRLAPAPLYTSFVDIEEAVLILKNILEENVHELEDTALEIVT